MKKWDESMSKTQSLKDTDAENVRVRRSKSIKPNPHTSDVICLERSSVYEEELPKCLHSGSKQAVREGHDLIEIFMRVKEILGRTPNFTELLDVFLQEEIDLLEFTLDIQTQEFAIEVMA
jgi:hypothetical protein